MPDSSSSRRAAGKRSRAPTAQRRPPSQHHPPSQPRPRSPARRRWLPWLAALALAAATFAAYRPALDAQFVNWDDGFNVYQNRYVTEPGDLGKIWFSTDNYQYYPLVFTSFWFDYHLFDARHLERQEIYDPKRCAVADVVERRTVDPAPFHRTNVLLHALNALLVWAVLRRLRVRGAYLAAAVFALHPVHVESVAWVSERKNVLMGFFFLLALAAALRSERRPGGGPYAAALFTYLLALLSKAVAAMLVPVLVVLRWRAGEPLLARRFLLRLVPYLVLGGAFGLVSSWFERTRQFQRLPLALDLAPGERLIVAGRAFWFYLGSLVWPADLMLVNPRWTIDGGAPLQYLWPFSVVVLCALLWLWRRRLGRGPLAAVLVFMVLLLPASGLFNVYWMVFSWVADHFQYLASLGVIALGCALAARAAGWVAGRVRRRVAPIACGGALLLAAAALLALGNLTHAGSRRFSDSWSLWEHALARNPNAWIAENYLGGMLAERCFEQAIPHFERALALFPDHPHASYNLGRAYLGIGDKERAFAQFTHALAVNPDNADLQNNYGTLLYERGRCAEAIPHFRRALALRPDFVRACVNLRVCLAETGELDAAEQALRACLVRQPQQVELNFRLGQLLLEAGRPAAALDHLEQAARSGQVACLDDYARALAAVGRRAEAAAQLERAARGLESTDPQGAAARRARAQALQ